MLRDLGLVLLGAAFWPTVRTLRRWRDSRGWMSRPWDESDD